MDKNNIIDPSLENDFEENQENDLRPQTLSEYIGQEKVKDNMKVFIEAAKKRGEALDHVLLYGPPGLGKTTLANIIANEMHSNIKITSGPAIERPGDLASILTSLQDRDVLFIDEIHRINTIVKRSARILNILIDDDAALEIARRSRGTPRIANRLLKRVRDYSLVLGDGDVNLEIAKIALNKLDIDEMGLDAIDKRILETMIEKYNGKPVGIETLSTTLGEEESTITDVYEPYLIQIGFIARTPRGRMVMPAAYKHMGYPYQDFF